MGKIIHRSVPYGQKEKKIEVKPGLYCWDQREGSILVLVQKEGENTFAYDGCGKKYIVQNHGSCLGDYVGAKNLRSVNHDQRIRILAHTLNELLIINGVVPKEIPEEKKRDAIIGK